MGSKFSGSFEQKLALDSYIKLFRASEILKAKISAVTNIYGFSDGQFYVLDALYHHGHLP